MRRILLALAMSATAAAACDANDAEVCSGKDRPAVLEVGDRVPALGATVKNAAIWERFMIEGSPIFFGHLDLVTRTSEQHTAGYEEARPDTWSCWAESGRDIGCSRNVETWSKAPAHVELEAVTGWQTETGCHYRLPSPLIAYDVTP